MLYKTTDTSISVPAVIKCSTSAASTSLHNTPFTGINSEVLAANEAPAGTAAVAFIATYTEASASAFITTLNFLALLGTVKLVSVDAARVAVYFWSENLKLKSLG